MISSAVWNKLMAKKDARMNTTTETVNNIKMIKLYGWADTFEERVSKKREDELKSMKKAFFVTSIVIWSLYFFPQMLRPVVFTTYIGLGNTLELKTTFTIMIFFNLIEVTIDLLIYFIGTFELRAFVLRRLGTDSCLS